MGALLRSVDRLRFAFSRISGEITGSGLVFGLRFICLLPLCQIQVCRYNCLTSRLPHLKTAETGTAGYCLRGPKRFRYHYGEMSIAPLPTPLHDLGGRRFSFYPPIRNLGPNEWLFRRATWSECVVMNARSGEEVWIPRMFLGEVSLIDEPVVDAPAMVVRLNRELEWKGGAILPRQRRVIQFPVLPNPNPVADPRSPADAASLAPVVCIRLEPKPEVRAWKWIGVAVVLGAVACTIVSNIAGQSQLRQHSDLFRGYRPWLQLSPDDDFSSTVRKLGVPSSVTSAAEGDRVFRTLTFSGKRYSAILMGSRKESARYIGTIDAHGNVLDAVRFRDGSSADPILRSLPGAVRFLPSSGLLRSLPAF